MSPLEAIDWSKVTFFTVSKSKLTKELFRPICIPNVDIYEIESFDFVSQQNLEFYQVACENCLKVFLISLKQLLHNQESSLTLSKFYYFEVVQ